MKALIIQHTQESPPGSSIVWLRARNFEYEIYWPREGHAWPGLETFDLLIICGGKMNVDEEELYPWLKDEKLFISQAIQKQKKIIGLCLGAQLLAELLGGEVKQSHTWEVGWHEVVLSNQQKITVFEYHGYCFTLPPDTTRTATNKHCVDQAFEYRDHVKAFQFHPEITAEAAHHFAIDPELPTHGFVQTKEQIISGIAKYQPLIQDWYFKQLDEMVRN